MKKFSKLIAIALATTSLFAFAACGDEEKDEDGTSVPSVNVPKDEIDFEQVSSAEQATVYAQFQNLFDTAADEIESMDKIYTKYNSTMEAVNSSLLHVKLNNAKETLNASCSAKWEKEIPATDETEAVPEVFEYAYQTIADSKAVYGMTLTDYDIEMYQYITNGKYYQKSYQNCPPAGLNNKTDTLQQSTTSSQLSQIQASLPSVKILDILSDVLDNSFTDMQASDIKLYKNETENAYKISFNMSNLCIDDLVEYCSYNSSNMVAYLRSLNIDPNTVRANYNLSYTMVLTEDNKLEQVKTVIVQTGEAAGYKKLFNGFVYHETAYLLDSLTIEFPADLADY